MLLMNAIPLLFGVLLGYLLGLVSRDFLKRRTSQNPLNSFDQFDQMLFLLMLLSTFVLGVFITYLFLSGTLAFCLKYPNCLSP